MKKMFITVILIILSFYNVKAEEKDKTIIEEYSSSIVLVSDNKYQISSHFDIYTKFGDNPKENYFYKLLRDKYSFNYKNEEYKLEYNILNIESDKGHGSLGNQEGTMYHFGELDKLLYEKEKIKMDYEVSLDKKQTNIYSFVINDNIYDTYKTKFFIRFPFKLNLEDIYFSIDGKNYKKEIQGLKYNLVDVGHIVGEYGEKLTENQKLTFMIMHELKTAKDSNLLQNLFIMASIVIVMVLLIIFIKKRKIIVFLFDKFK